jgi:hypothetical protein
MTIALETGFAVGTLVLTASLAGCKDARLEPKVRPAGVPATATWVGGADGGAYVECSVDAVRDVNRCGVWNDYTGDGQIEDYQIVKENRAATKSELRIEFPDPGGLIYLENGMILKRL